MFVAWWEEQEKHMHSDFLVPILLEKSLDVLFLDFKQKDE